MLEFILNFALGRNKMDDLYSRACFLSGGEIEC